MLLDAPFKVVGDAGIIGIIVAKQYVDKVLVHLNLKIIKIFRQACAYASSTSA